MAEKDKFKSAPSVIPTFAELAMGQARLGLRALDCELRNHITDEMIEQYISEQERDPIRD